MGKKKAQSDTEKESDSKSIEKFNIDNFKTCFFKANDIIEQKKQVIPISPSLDIALGGGVPEGSSIIFTGPPKVGKTTACLQLAANAQKYAGKMIYYLNIEGRIKKRDIQGINGIDLSEDKFMIIGSSPDKILFAHDYLDIALHLLKTQKNVFVILDSVSQLCSEGRISESVGNRFRDDVPLMLASFTKQLASFMGTTNNMVAQITHIIANQGNGPSPNMEASGKKVQYQGDVKLRATHKTDYVVSNKQVGQEVHWIIEFSAIGPPMQKCDSLLRYGIGLDKEYDLINMCTDIGLITKGGAWYTIGEDKIQGLEKACVFLRENPDIYDKLLNQFNEISK